jgi:hypothetical protein
MGKGESGKEGKQDEQIGHVRSDGEKKRLPPGRQFSLLVSKSGVDNRTLASLLHSSWNVHLWPDITAELG